MKLTMIIGLPGSGKTTWARAQCARADCQTYRVNKDDIRRGLEETVKIDGQPWSWSPEREQQVLDIRDSRIENALKTGFNVISDDTNFGRKHKVRLEQLARKYGAEFLIQDFTKVPVDECIRRDEQRTGKARVGEAVIRKMAALYLEPAMSDNGGFDYSRFAPVGKQDWALPRALICDLDGTLALFKEKGHRGPYDASRCAEDDLNGPVYRTLMTFWADADYRILYVSGREEKYREATLTFLRKHQCPQEFDAALFMRATGDKRKDWIVKGEIFDREIRGKYYIDFVLDDRNQVVGFWRAIGLTCFQVAKGDF